MLKKIIIAITCLFSSTILLAATCTNCNDTRSVGLFGAGVAVSDLHASGAIYATMTAADMALLPAARVTDAAGREHLVRMSLAASEILQLPILPSLSTL
jgi:hypothetical protein